MKKILAYIPHSSLAYLACIGVVIGLFFGKAIISISVTLFMVNAIINLDVKKNIKTFISLKTSVAIAAIFFTYLISGIWSSNLDYYLQKIFMHLPYLTIAVGLVCMRFKEAKYYHLLFALLILLTTAGCVQSLWQYLSNKNAIDLGYNYSKVLPTPFKNDHIRFSIAVVLSIVFSSYLAIIQKQKVIKLICTCLAIFLIIYLHILAVKTGLLAFYIIAFISIVYFIFTSQKKIIGLIALVLLCSLPVVALQFSNTFKAKFNYFKYSLQQINNTNSQEEISDEGRIMSYKTCLEIWQKNKLLGVGAGDFNDAMIMAYDKKYGVNKLTKKMLPHNQFMVISLVAGILGLLVFSYAIFLPLLLHYRKNLLFICVWVLMLIPLMVEPMHETQIGLSIHVFFILLLYKYIDNKNSNLAKQ